MLVPCSLGHPRTSFSTNLRNSYTKLSLSYPREHLPFYTRLSYFTSSSQTQKVWQVQGKGTKGISVAESTLEELPGGVQDTQCVFGQSNGFFLQEPLLKDIIPGWGLKHHHNPKDSHVAIPMFLPPSDLLKDRFPHQCFPHRHY